MNVSVVICTHNPRPDYLKRVLEALRVQTLPAENWEVLLIDNASREPLAAKWDLSALPNARHLLETNLGLTAARLRAIDEVRGDILVFVDDDNVLDPRFLEESLKIGREWPILGAWGGQLIAEHEAGAPHEAWKRHIFETPVLRDAWSNNYDRNTTPAGGGASIRREVAIRYAKLVREDPMRLALGRKGTALNAGEDIDMAYVACDMGLGTGMFSRLQLLHLIPATRLTEEYLNRLKEGFGHANTVLGALRGKMPPNRPLTDRAISFLRRWRVPRDQRAWHAAYDAGRRRAIRELYSIASKQPEAS